MLAAVLSVNWYVRSPFVMRCAVLTNVRGDEHEPHNAQEQARRPRRNCYGVTWEPGREGDDMPLLPSTPSEANSCVGVFELWVSEGPI